MDTMQQGNPQQGGIIKDAVPIIIFGIAIVFLGWLLAFPLDVVGSMLPEQASAEGVRTDSLFRVLFMLGTIVFLLVQGLLYYAAIRYRVRPGDTSDAEPVHGNATLEIVWTLIPSVIVVVLAILSFLVWTQNVEPSAADEINVINGEPVSINAIGWQWAWRFDYKTNAVNANGDPIEFSSGNLHVYIPDDGSNREFALDMITQDVIHSFWVPAMRVKQDLLPGRTTDVRFTPIEVEEGFEHIYVQPGTTIYTDASADSDVLEQLAAPQDDSEVLMPTELELTENIGTNAGFSDWVAVQVGRDDVTGYVQSADITGRFNKYRIVCTELCGTEHGAMFTWMYVHADEEQFVDSWYEPQVASRFTPPSNPVEAGRQLLANDAYPCAGCHVLDSLDGWNGAVGPVLNGLGNRAAERASAAGTTSAADYIAQSIRRPNDYIVGGYAANIMPYFGNTQNAPSGVSNYNVMPQEDLNAIVAYLCTQTTSGDPADTACDLNGDAEGNGITDDGELTDVDASVEALNDITDDYQQ